MAPQFNPCIINIVRDLVNSIEGHTGIELPPFGFNPAEKFAIESFLTGVLDHYGKDKRDNNIIDPSNSSDGMPSFDTLPSPGSTPSKPSPQESQSSTKNRDAARTSPNSDANDTSSAPRSNGTSLKCARTKTSNPTSPSVKLGDVHTVPGGESTKRKRGEAPEAALPQSKHARIYDKRTSKKPSSASSEGARRSSASSSSCPSPRAKPSSFYNNRRYRQSDACCEAKKAQAIGYKRTAARHNPNLEKRRGTSQGWNGTHFEASKPRASDCSSSKTEMSYSSQAHKRARRQRPVFDNIGSSTSSSTRKVPRQTRVATPPPNRPSIADRVRRSPVFVHKETIERRLRESLKRLEAIKDDHYKVLGIDPSTPKVNLGKIWRAISLRHHPDKNLNDYTATARFQIMQHSISVLQDDEKRQAYDSKYAYNLNGIGARKSHMHSSSHKYGTTMLNLDNGFDECT